MNVGSKSIVKSWIRSLRRLFADWIELFSITWSRDFLFQWKSNAQMISEIIACQLY